MKKRRKFRTAVFVILAVMTVFISHVSFAQEPDEIKIKVDGVLLECDQPPVMVNERILVPLRTIFNALYADVEWLEETQTVFASKRFKTISLPIGSSQMFLDGETIQLDSPAILLNGRTMVPVRAVSEALGAEVLWDQDSNTVIISGVHENHYISDHYIKETIKSDDGQYDLLKISVSYPQIRNDENNTYIDELNQILKDNAGKSFESLKEEYVPAAREFYNEVLLNEPEMKSTNLPFEVTQKFDIPYDNNDIISMVMMTYWWTGGAHPNSIKTSVTYDLKNGKELKLTDIFNKSQSEINAMIIEAFTEQINENPDGYFNDSAELVKEEIENVGFYLSDEGITFYFNPYAIAPYVAGYPSVTLSFDSKYGFIDSFIRN